MIVEHLFLRREPAIQTETLIIGTFNPKADCNDAKIFYGRNKNYLWTLLSAAFGEPDLKPRILDEKMNFMDRRKIDFVDLISEVNITAGEEGNYRDAYIDGRVTKWRNIIAVAQRLIHLKRVCVSRRTFSDVPNIKNRINEIEGHLRSSSIVFGRLISPARYYSSKKQAVWTDFLHSNSTAI